MKIGVDLDGVIADFCLAFSELCNSKYGTPIITEREQVVKWSLSELLDLTHNQINEVFNEIDESGSFWRVVPVLDRPSFNYFKKHFNNEEVYFITNRNRGRNIFKQTVSWLDNLGWINPQVVVTDYKYKVIDGLNLEWFLDDKLMNCTEIYEHTKCTPVIYDYPHNRKCDFKRVSNLAEFTNLVLGSSL